MAKTVYYRDLDLNFNRHPITNDVTQLIDTDAVKRSLRNLLAFKKYEKPFHSEINAGIYDAFFELQSPLAMEKMRDTIASVISKYEKRVKLSDVQIRPNLDGNSFEATLLFYVVNVQTPQTFSFNIVRNR